MTTTAAILETLTAAFADIDAADLAKEIEWARGRKAALDAFYASDEFIALKSNGGSVSERINSICGDTSWYNVLLGSDAKIVAFCTKNSAKRAAKRHAKIAKDLDKVGIMSVESAEVAVNNGGFDGVYRVTTDKGDKMVRINTIYAGGYNIQCLHTRVLVSVK